MLTFEYGSRPHEGEDYDDDPGNVAPLIGVYLSDTATGARTRIDADSAGVPMVAAWQNQGSCGNEWCDNFYDYPSVFVGLESVSRDGRKVAFCTNYAEPRMPILYVKDLRSGGLARTGLRCPVLDAMGGESTFTRAPEISADGRVVHVNGDVAGTGDPTFRWTADTLYFTKTAGTRKVSGWGSMTRNGGTVFMRLGVPKRATTRPAIRVGAYNVKTRKVVRLAGRDTIYGTDVMAFAAYEQASYRGRFVASMLPVLSGGTSGALLDVRVWVTDRSTGLKADLGAILKQNGYQASEDQRPIISGDGKVVLARVTTADSEHTQLVAITGWGADGSGDGTHQCGPVETARERGPRQRLGVLDVPGAGQARGRDLADFEADLSDPRRARDAHDRPEGRDVPSSGQSKVRVLGLDVG